MIRVFVDANVFLRFLTRDDSRQADEAVRLFERARDGKVQLVSGPPVAFEVLWTLRSRYKQTLGVVLDLLDALLAAPGLEWLDRAVMVEAARLARERQVDFADAYIAASSQQASCDAIATFNQRDFVRLGAQTLDLAATEKPVR